MTIDPDELLERYETMRGELERLRVKARSADLSVSVESGPGGGVVSVTLSAEALRQSPQALSASITATIQAAAGKAAEATRHVVAPFLADADLAASAASSRLPPLGEHRPPAARAPDGDGPDEPLSTERRAPTAAAPSEVGHARAPVDGGLEDADDGDLDEVFGRG